MHTIPILTPGEKLTELDMDTKTTTTTAIRSKGCDDSEYRSCNVIFFSNPLLLID